MTSPRGIDRGWQPGEGTPELVEEIHHGGRSGEIRVPPVASFSHAVKGLGCLSIAWFLSIILVLLSWWFFILGLTKSAFREYFLFFLGFLSKSKLLVVFIEVFIGGLPGFANFWWFLFWALLRYLLGNIFWVFFSKSKIEFFGGETLTRFNYSGCWVL